MDALNDEQLHAFLARVNVPAADSGRGIGRELSYRPLPLRVVVIHFGESDSHEYISRVVSVVLSAREAWVLIPRHCAASALGIPDVSLDAEALAFGASERQR